MAGLYKRKPVYQSKPFGCYGVIVLFIPSLACGRRLGISLESADYLEFPEKLTTENVYKHVLRERERARGESYLPLATIIKRVSKQ